MWLDTRNAANNTDSQLFYSFSTDGGVTWAPNVAVSAPFTPFEGYPVQNKIGDYITIVSDNTGGDVAYPATFNFNPNSSQHEEDVYFVRVSPTGGPTPTPTATATAIAYSDRYGYSYSDGNTDSHGNYNAQRYSYRYAKADAHATIRSDTQTASYTAAKAMTVTEDEK